MANRLLFISFFLLFSVLSFSQVRVYEGKETIPTYKRAKDVPSPIFYTGRGVQGAAGKMYPYPAQTDLGDKLVNVTYDMVYLENEYIKVTILPAFGGKIHKAVDKTNGYEIIHSNTTIKPDLIGTLGAWVSGGIEWCFPHHHRPSSLMPADYLLKENKDGSATVWIGETERTLRLRGLVGVTLHPGRSYFEVEYRINNPTDVTKTFLFWANASMTANENYRTFWPPSQEIAVNHNNSDFTHWPVSHSNYSGTDYTSGVDLTWWKNHPEPKSLFFWQAEEGFIGGYDYGKDAGTVHVGNVYENKTSKLFQFGPGTTGQAYRKKLTDDGKAYVELMTGTFSNNQPDYAWFAPHSVKDATNYWYGIRDIEMAKNANIDAAVTLQMKDKKTVFYGFNTTRKFSAAKIILSYGDDVLVNQVIDIDPANPYTATYKGKREIDEYNLFVQLLDKNGNELISYKPWESKKPELPEVQERLKPADELENVEDLYLTGRFVEQFYRPFHNPDDYYFAALEKSPSDYRVNLALGMRRIKQWKYEEALEYIQRAADKLKVKYWQPKQGEVFYYMALAQKAIGEDEDAYRNFYQSTWYYEWFSAGFYQLALLESKKGNYQKALEYIKEAYSTNNNDGRIVLLYTSLLRTLEKTGKALDFAEKLLDFDPLNYAAYYEKGLLEGKDLLSEHHDKMMDVENSYLDIAVNYFHAGLYKDGIDLLNSIESPQNPLVLYYLAWFYENDDQSSKAREMLERANNASTEYIFPYRKETEQVLTYAVKANPENSIAFYLLGNLLFDNRKDDAIDAWENALSIEKDDAMTLRNLAFGTFHHEQDVNKAIDYLKRALGQDKNQPLWYAELAKYYEASELDYRECLAILEENIDIVKIDARAPKEVVKLLNLDGQYDKSIEMLNTHHFRTWEGGRIIHSYYVDAHMLRALEYTDEGKFDKALEDLQAALLYPDNLEVGKPNSDGRSAMVNYTMGIAYDAKGMKRKAKEYYEKSASADNSSGELKYYQGMAFQMLGNREQAYKLFKELIKEGRVLIDKGATNSGIGVDEVASSRNTLSNAYYLQALGKKGLGEEREARELFEKALQVQENNIWAKYYFGL